MQMLHAALAACSEPFADDAAKKAPLKQLREAVKHLETTKASRAMLGYARLLITTPDFETGLDRDRHLLGTPSGVLDLRTGEPVPAAERPKVSMAVRPRWRGLDTPHPGRRRLLPHGVRRGRRHGRLHAGPPGSRHNGRAPRGLRLLRRRWRQRQRASRLAGCATCSAPYYHEADPYIFFGDKSHHNGPTPALAELDRKRLAVVDESNPKDELNLAIVKRVTGTDVISCRAMYQDPKQMQVTHTQILLTNNLPKFDVG